MKTQKISILLISALVLTSLSMQGAKKGANEKEVREVRAIIEKVNDYWQNSNPAEKWAFWDIAAYHTGNMEAYKLTGNPKYLDYSTRWAEHNQWKGAKSDDRSKWKYSYGENDEHVLFGDWQICFQTYADLYNLKPDYNRIKRAREVMEYEMSTPRNDYWWWSDGLYMVMPVMTKLYNITGNQRYLDKLHEYLQVSDSIMYDAEEGLYYRDAKYVYPKHKSANGKKDFWARGDGWVLAGLAKVLADLPQNYEHRKFFEDKYKKMADAVVACQQPGGYWSRSMYDEAHAPGPETSGTAFFTYGLLWGLNHGYLHGDKYLNAAMKGWNYLKNTALQKSGRIGYVQPIGEKAIPGQVVDANSTAPFGVGAFLLAACEYDRMLEGVDKADYRAKNIVPDKKIVQYGQWLDTDGNPINAHGGGILYHNGKYYWYGEYKVGKTVLPEWATWEAYRTDVTGVSCYSSPDMVNWTFEGLALAAEPEIPGSDLHPGKVLERPKVVYNPKTGKFVMWVHAESADYSKAAAGVAISDTPTGPFTYLGSFRPNQAMSRDQTIFVDDDGKAYQFTSSENNATMYINELTDDYLKPTGKYTRNFIGESREAPAVFKHNGKYYVLTSGCTAWDPNQAGLAVADNVMGPWKKLGNPCTGPEADKTFYAQSTYVQPIAGKKDAYVAMFDRWNKTDLADSRYVWLPIDFSGETPTMPWRDEWNMDVFEDQGSFEAGDGTFLLNGEPFVVKAAELHYPRIPREYWEHRIKMCKALGMNTICLYTFWNSHEPTPDNFNFEGQNDLRAFVKLCQENDMKVILRPGPYVCAEWEMGGLPWWLLKKKDIRLRENDPYFLERVDKFQKAVADQVKDLTIDNGGPIIMVQVENEYGSYGIDKEYVANIRDMLRRNFGNNVTLFQCDWSSNFLNNGLDDLIWTMNFGTGANIDQQFARLKEVRPNSPLMCSEFWSGWFDKWGGNHETRPADDMIAGLTEMLDKNISFSLYMTHGGTNWGHWAGANSPGFAPDVTSYDYDAPINEQGAATPKYYALRNALANYTTEKLPEVPKAIPVTTVKEFEFSEVAPLFANLPAPKKDNKIKTMEEYDQGFGSILYRTTLPATSGQSVLTVNDPHDYAQVFIDGKYIGKLDRRLGEKSLTLPAIKGGAQLDILIEAMGRINFGRAIKDFKGITDNVTLTTNKDGFDYVTDLKDWEVFNLPDTEAFYQGMKFTPINSATRGDNGRLPIGVYRARFNVNKAADTFINMETWGKGLVYINGHAIGRFWEIGPQQTLYVPGSWLKKGENEILVFDITGPKQAKSEGLAKPIIDKLQTPKPATHRKEDQTLNLTGEKPVKSGSFAAGNGWQKIEFDKEVTGRYVTLECLNAINGGNNAAIAEFYLLDGNGERLSREPWTVVYADAEDVTDGNRAADKIFDLQESTFWSTGKKAPFPHSFVLDLGAEHTLTGFEYLPRMEADVPGAIKDFNIYVSTTPFKLK